MFCPATMMSSEKPHLPRDEIRFVNRALDKTNLRTARANRRRRRHLIRIVN